MTPVHFPRTGGASRGVARVRRWPTALAAVLAVALVGCSEDVITSSDSSSTTRIATGPTSGPTTSKPAQLGPLTSPDDTFGMFTAKGNAAVSRIVRRAEIALRGDTPPEQAMSELRTAMGSLLDRSETDEAGDTDVCEQVADVLDKTLLAIGEERIEACDELIP